MSESYLAGLSLAGRRVLVVGGGSVAQRRLPGLLASEAEVLLVAPALTPAVEAIATAGEIAWAARHFDDDDLDGAWYALALTDDPGRAAAVRDGVVEALREGRLDTLPRRATGSPPLPGVAIVGGGPGDPDLITVRGRRLLAHADVVVSDRLAPQALLAELAPQVEVIDAAKLPRGRSMAQASINQALVSHALAGRFVVRLKGGDPYVFGRGYEEVLACARAGVPVTVVPGVTSAIAVPGLAGIPLTHRGVAHEAVIVSGHLAPDDPASLVDWPGLARLRGTLVLLMAVERLAQIAAVLVANGRPPQTAAAIVQDGSLPTERVLRTTLVEVADVAAREGVRPPSIVVIGGVAALDGPAVQAQGGGRRGP